MIIWHYCRYERAVALTKILSNFWVGSGRGGASRSPRGVCLLYSVQHLRRPFGLAIILCC